MMRAVLIAAIALTACLKIRTDANGTVVKISHPFSQPVDSPNASCMRATGESIFICGMAFQTEKRDGVVLWSSGSACDWCADAALSISRATRSSADVDDYIMRSNAFHDGMASLDDSAKKLEELRERLQKR